MEYFYHEQLTDLDDTGFGVIFDQKPGTYMPPHWHQAVELLLFIRGSVVCKFSHSVFRAKPGDIYIINSHDVHETRCSEDAQYLCIHILPSAMCKYVPNFDQLNFSFKFDPDEPIRSGAFSRIRGHLLAILKYKQKKSEASALEIHARLYALAAILVKHFSSAVTLEKHKLQRNDILRLEPLLEYTRLHHQEALSLDNAADYVGLNREYFCRLFKKNMGVSYLTYLNQIRATAVCRDLETSDDPIGTICERHGFANPKMMNQYFRELYNCTPSEKRKEYRKMISDGIY